MTMLFMGGVLSRLLNTAPLRPEMPEWRPTVVPSRAVVFASLFRSKDLRRTLSPVSHCEGVDMHAANQLRVEIRSETGEVDAGLHATALPLSQWRHGDLTMVTDVVQLLNLDLNFPQNKDAEDEVDDDPHTRRVRLCMHPSFGCRVGGKDDDDDISRVQTGGGGGNSAEADDEPIADVVVLWVDYDMKGSTKNNISRDGDDDIRSSNGCDGGGDDMDDIGWLHGGLQTPYACQGVICLAAPLRLRNFILKEDGEKTQPRQKAARRGGIGSSCGRSTSIGEQGGKSNRFEHSPGGTAGGGVPLTLALSARLGPEGDFLVAIYNDTKEVD
uniref:Uncharacterized protein n=1 Tax=Octactis speculum TaxID=3111310 RepID=A0A7S2BBA6_9STRA